MDQDPKKPSEFQGTSSKIETSVNSGVTSDINSNEITVGEHDVIDTSTLPGILQRICNAFQEKDRVMMLLSTLTVISSLMPTLFGYYNHHRVHANLFLYILGKAGSGKGNMNWTRRLIPRIQAHLNNPGNQASDAAHTTNTTGWQIILPANNSSAGFMQLFHRNDGKGLLLETEGDTFSNVLKTDYGNYSDLLRKAFHHETISQYRKGDGLRIVIDRPMLSVLVSSTPNQLKKIIPDAENGLFSRFMFYFAQPEEGFLNVFSGHQGMLEQTFDDASLELLHLYREIFRYSEIKFELTKEQQAKFHAFFGVVKAHLVNLVHDDLEGTANRMGIITFRLAMILTVLRNQGRLTETLICSDEDYSTAEKLATMLLRCANDALQILLSKKAHEDLTGMKYQLYQMLPDQFDTATAKRYARQLQGLSDRTIDRFLKSGCFENVGHGLWAKVHE